MATDIAFALGVMMLLGKRVPDSLKVALVAIAILDDLVAIIIIALFYTSTLSLVSLAVGLGAIAVLFVLNVKKVQSIAAYVLTGIVFLFTIRFKIKLNVIYFYFICVCLCLFSVMVH